MRTRLQRTDSVTPRGDIMVAAVAVRRLAGSGTGIGAFASVSRDRCAAPAAREGSPQCRDAMFWRSPPPLFPLLPLRRHPAPSSTESISPAALPERDGVEEEHQQRCHQLGSSFFHLQKYQCMKMRNNCLRLAPRFKKIILPLLKLICEF